MNRVAARPAWARLGAELRRLRSLAGVNQRDIAAACGMSQTTVLRIEHGEAVPSLARVTAWAGACQAATPDMGHLRALTEAALDERARFHDYLRIGLEAVQRDVAATEATATTLRVFLPWGIPALLQTGSYAAAVLAMCDYHQAGGIEAASMARLERQAILYGEGRVFEFVVTEAALRFRPGPPAVLAAALTHLAATVTLPSVTFGVIPATAQVATLPLCGFVIHTGRDDGQDPLVTVEIPHEYITVAEPADVKIYIDQFALLRQSAVFGDGAVELVRGVERSLREGG